MDRFELQGIVYYQQGRKCGKTDCACASGELHGPYWYARDVYKVSYLGKELPGNVVKARAALSKSQKRIEDKIAEIQKTVRTLELKEDTLKYLAAGRALSPLNKAIVRTLGFGACLVSDEIPDRAASQHKTGMATA